MIYLECKLVPYQREAEIIFTNQYLMPPVVTVSLCYNFLTPGEQEVTSYNIYPTIVYLIEQNRGINKYRGIKVIWSGEIDTIYSAYISMMAVCRDDDN